MRVDPSSVSDHDHVGSMVYGTTACCCLECGQAWWLAAGRGWQPIVDDTPTTAEVLYELERLRSREKGNP